MRHVRFASFVVVAVHVLTVAACADRAQDASSGSSSSSSPSPSSSSSSSSASASSFVGTWTYGPGSKSTVACFVGDAAAGFDATLPFDGGGAPLDDADIPQMGAVTIALGGDGTLAVVSDDGCSAWTYTVDGDVATAKKYQSCPAASGPQGTTYELVVEQSTLTLSADGASMVEDTAEQAYGICTQRRQATLVKVSQ